MRQGVLRAPLQRGGQRERLGLVAAFPERHDAREDGPALGEGASLVEGEGLEPPRRLERRSALDRMPRREAAPMPETTVTGVEITRAHGQAMIRSASAR